MSHEPLLTGLALAAVTCLASVRFPPRRSLEFFAAVLAATSSVYLGAALADGRTSLIFLESVAYLPVFALALAGLWRSSPAFLAAGYVAHGAWDFFHHPLRLGASGGERFPDLCVAYDVVVGLFILYQARAARSAAS